MRKITQVVAALLLVTSPLSASVLSIDGFQLSLYTSFEYEYQIEDEGLGDPNGSFDLDQIDVVFGYQKDNLRVAMDIVLEHGVVSEENFGNVELSFGFAEWAFSDALKIRAGKFLTPFGIQNEFNTVRSSFLTVKNPRSNYKPEKITSNGFRFAPRRQVGLGAVGGLEAGAGYLQYDFLISNGFQEESNPYEEDNNTHKAITARVVYELFSSLSIGGSFYHDTLTEEDFRWGMNSYGVQADYDGSKLLVRAEVFAGSIDPSNNDETDEVDQLGAYICAGYHIGIFTPYLQYGYVKTEEGDHDETSDEIVLGLFWQVRPNVVIKVENGYVTGSEENIEFDGIPDRAYNEIRMALVFGF